MMKVAVPSDDQKTIARHFGRTRGFLLFEIRGEVIEPAGYRPIDAPRNACSCSRPERATRHQLFLDALDGTKTVIARNMGAHMYDDLISCGFTIALTDVEDASSAVQLFATRSLPDRGELGCENQPR